MWTRLELKETFDTPGITITEQYFMHYKITEDSLIVKGYGRFHADTSQGANSEVNNLVIAELTLPDGMSMIAIQDGFFDNGVSGLRTYGSYRSAITNNLDGSTTPLDRPTGERGVNISFAYQQEGSQKVSLGVISNIVDEPNNVYGFDLVIPLVPSV